jgi:hypothetical protein
MRYELQRDEREPIYHARTAANLMARDNMVEDQFSPKAHNAFRAAYKSLPATAEVTELQSLMASIAHADLNVINGDDAMRQSVMRRLQSVIEEARTILEQRHTP